jgi:two-component system LytT family response regulator
VETRIDTIVIEPVTNSAKTICSVLESFSELNIIARSNTFENSIELISNYSPQLVFIDLSMKDEDGLKIVQHFQHRNFEIVIVAENSDFATAAFKYSVLHYLLKPISQYQAKQVIERILDKPQHYIIDKISVEHETVKSTNNRIYLLTGSGINVVNVDEIVYCEENNNGTLVHLKNDNTIQASEQLAVFEKLPALTKFSKINQLQLINLNFLRNIIKADCNRVILENDKNLFVSENFKFDFFAKLSEIALVS